MIGCVRRQPIIGSLRTLGLIQAVIDHQQVLWVISKNRFLMLRPKRAAVPVAPSQGNYMVDIEITRLGIQPATKGVEPLTAGN